MAACGGQRHTLISTPRAPWHARWTSGTLRSGWLAQQIRYALSLSQRTRNPPCTRPSQRRIDFFCLDWVDKKDGRKAKKVLKRKKEFADKSSRARRARRDAVRKLFFSLTVQRWAKLSTHLSAEGREKKSMHSSVLLRRKKVRVR